ncbi:MAG TPA: serine hydrolase domain-containing protein [Verrucomicrobiae bacterium]|nr:serine hydrolase domain-containing protein [Verrucomicrobiae bacterium]
MRKPPLTKLPILVLVLATLAAPAIRADHVDDVVTSQMKEHGIIGLSLAIIENGKLDKVKGYGFTDKSGNVQVTASTLFQAGSISKSVAAVGALHLVEEGKLSLDEDVNRKLISWKVPENEFTKDKKVTLRGILSHSAGLTVHGFPGYAVYAPMPTLVQVLDGTKPANTSPIRVDIVPGSKWRYSGGGYTVMQQMMIDVTGKPFPEFMQATVLKPFGMDSSTYEQPLPKSLSTNTAAGYHPGGVPVFGRWHVYPEMAAAGLWTTASDLARFAIAIEQTLADKTNTVISQSMVRQILTPQMADDGLGVFLAGKGKTLRFFHDGRDDGFDASMTAFAETGQGAVIMIDANDNVGAIKRIMAAIAKQYDWPEAEVAAGK